LAWPTYPRAAPAPLVTSEDEGFDIRWLAAEGQITLGPVGAAPLLAALAEKADSVYLREGAHPVMYDLSHRGLKDPLPPVMAALEGVDPKIEIPEPARKARFALGG